MHCAQLSHLTLRPCYLLMATTPIKRVLRCSGHVRLADGTRNPVLIVAQRMDYVWVKVSRPTRLPGGRILQPGETACVHRGRTVNLCGPSTMTSRSSSPGWSVKFGFRGLLR